jgi:uncharacterized protein (DUF58 family)
VASSGGRQPTLTGRACYVLALALVLLIVGAGTSSVGLAAAGLTVVALLCVGYVACAARAALLWRRYLELVWWLPRSASAEGLVAHRPFEVQVTLRNLSPLSLGLGELRVFASRPVEVDTVLPPVALRPQRELTARLSVRVLQPGQWFVHGAAVRLTDPLGLFSLEAYFPSSLKLKVLPRQQPRASLHAARVSGGAAEQRVGAHTLRQHGVGGDLRELREYVPGDPFKLIAWKASARMPPGQLLVRELERETLLVHYLLLDIGVTMREGRPGQTKLDHALELALAYARGVLDGGDRIGLIAFDGEMFRHVKPGDGPTQRLKLTERLLDVMNVVDERFVAMTDGELCAAVARYLRQQEGLDVRVRHLPAIDDQRAWEQLVVSPRGERYHKGQLLAAAYKLVHGHPPEGIPADLAVLRQLCLQRGIELPYGQRSAAERARGLAQALELCAGTPGAQVVLISDLLGLASELPEVAAAAARCRRRGLRLSCLRPEARRYLPKDLLAEPAANRAAEIFSWEHSRQEAEVHRALARLGFHVLAVGPEESFAQILLRSSSKQTSKAPAPPQNQQNERAGRGQAEGGGSATAERARPEI